MQAAAIPMSQETSWGELYVRLRPTLLRGLAALSGSYAGVEDAIQDAFAEGMARPVSEIRAPEAWLFVVARNRLRRERRLSSLKRRLGLTLARNAHELDQTLVRLDVSSKLLRLRERDRELLIAKYYIGMTQDEIANLLRVPRGTVSAAVSRAAARYRALDQESER